MEGRKKYIWLITAFLFLSFSVFAQQAKLQRAAQFKEELNFQKALKLYAKVERQYHLPEAMIGLADCYRMIGNYQKAESWYQKALLGMANPSPAVYLQLGRMLQRNGKCEQANLWLREYRERIGADPVQTIDICQVERTLGNKGVGSYELYPVDFNSPAHDFSPLLFEGGLLFASDREEASAEGMESAWTGNPFTSLFSVSIRRLDESACFPLSFGATSLYSARLQSELNDASASYCQQTGELFVTQNQQVRAGKGVARLTISIYRLDSKGNWTRQASLPIENTRYSIAHPSISPGGERLYFASDMPGGYGGMDLYFIERLSGSWGAPQNLGPTVNTEGNEVFPVFREGGKLSFASEGHLGMGGLDIWETQLSSAGTWSLPENPGFPINSSADDFGLVWTYGERCGFLTSNRAGGLGKDDIYLVHKVSVPTRLQVRGPENKPLQGVLISSDCAGIQAVTDVQGMAEFELPVSRCCTLKAEAAGFLSKGIERCTYNVESGKWQFIDLRLEERVELALEGIVFDKGTGLPLANAQVLLQSSCEADKDQRLRTNNTGHYRFSIAADCCYRLKVAKEAYLTEVAEDFCTYGMSGKVVKKVDMQVQPIIFDGANFSPALAAGLKGVYYDVRSGIWVDEKSGFPAEGAYPDGKRYRNGYLLEGGRESRPADPSFRSKALPEADEPIPFYLDISFLPGEAVFTQQSLPSLEKLLDLLKENPRIVIEVGVHTDARGSSSRNRRLSQKRAEGIVDWLAARGVQSRRLVGRGYGESQLLNHCDEGVPCSEAEHALNNRTEFRVIRCQGCPF